ncbi:MAG: putative rane protein [Herbinix sp.]|jgi:hypothetical protein|nr:putative rane protein [Herbinix sp.]
MPGMSVWKKHWNTVLFVCIQTFLYGVFLTLDITGSNTNLSNGVKFFIIILCFCYVLFYRKSTDKSILYILRAGLFFTVISDLFLLLLDYYVWGVISFIVVQQLYAFKLDLSAERSHPQDMGKGILPSFFIRICLQLLMTGLLCVILLLLGIDLDILITITIVYFISIVTNVIHAIKECISSAGLSSSLFAGGMILFLLCDINVGLFNLADVFNLSGQSYDLIYSLSSILMWTFYAPSQVLIALSAVKQQNRQKI